MPFVTVRQCPLKRRQRCLRHIDQRVGDEDEIAPFARPALAGKFHGVVTQGELQPADYERMREGNVGTLRLRVSWDRIERTAGAPPQWAWLDEVVDLAARNGIRVLPEVEDQSLVICSFCPTSGLFTERREPKPAWRAFKRSAR